MIAYAVLFLAGLATGLLFGYGFGRQHQEAIADEFDDM